NQTIDDLNGDSKTGALPVFQPTDGWAQGNTCIGCRVNNTIADVHKAFDGTWHDSTYHPGQPDRVITMSFNGTAVWAYTLLANQIAWTTTMTNLSFSVDGVHKSVFTHNPDTTTDILYQQQVFSMSGLQLKPHTLEIRATGTDASLILFDYVMYT
ncbi:uncharacterized protein BXZ73DRAFT_36142, partial [Epithele typhae]|uniref:uncharacterized protein n=1 Tax=Epithele typhae TaxID=378194 RepID=UPI0020085472